MGLGHLKIFFFRAMKQEAEFYMKALWLRTKASLLKSWPPRVWWGKWIIIKCIFDSIWAKVSQVSDVAHGPLVFVFFVFCFLLWMKIFNWNLISIWLFLG
jgi:hypothetical protein